MINTSRPLLAACSLFCFFPALADDYSEARAAYPGHFSRPPSQGKGYNTWADASGPDVGETKVDPKRLPSRVDNSERPEFPPVYKQRWGACGQFASVASIFTYEMNILNGTVADSDATRFPAHFSWNMMNRAENKGSEAYHGWEVAKRIGIPTAKSYGGVRLNKIGVWPNGYNIWREAMEYRVSGYRYTPANTIEQLNEARGWMFDRNQPGKKSIGGIMALDGRMGELKKVTVTIPEGEHEAGEDIWTRWGPSGYGHGITCVGYDDEVGYDVNGDGKITNDLDTNDDGKVTLADWERGAYIVVNSWGDKWSKDGRIYLLYSAMIDPTWKRGNYLGRAEVTRYLPEKTLKLRLSCNDRSDLRMTIGIAADKDASKAEHEITPEAFNGWPLFRGSNAGHVPIAGPDDDSSLEVGIDLTPLFDKLGGKKATKLFLNLTRADGSMAKGELHTCAIRSYDSKGKFLNETEVEINEGSFGESSLGFQSIINTDRGNEWGQAAGPNGNFIVEGKAPTDFSVTRNRHVLWRTALPNTGQGSVVISNGRVFVASHAPTEKDAEAGSLIVGQCFDAATGKELWRRELPGTRVTDLSSLFSDNTAASPVTDGERVCFTNVGGSMKCFDFDGKELWSKQWVPFGRHHSRQHEPILHDGKVIVVRVKPSDLDPEVTTKGGAKPLGRDRAYWTWLHAYDMKTGQLVWTGESGTGIHATPMLGKNSSAILTARGGGHQPPEEPYGISLLNADNGKTIWDLPLKGYASHQNAVFNTDLAAQFVGNDHFTIDLKTGKIRDKVSVMEGVQVCRQLDGKYLTESDQKLNASKKPFTYQTNLLTGDYHYFRTFSGFRIGRVNVKTGKVEYLEVPVQVVQGKAHWTKALPNDMRNAKGFLATQDKRNAGNGWGHCSAASPIVVGEHLYMPTMIGMVYVLKWNAPVLDENALVSISDLGPAGKTWSLSSLSYQDGKIYARTMKELICIGNAE
ncbi:PQQ-binding-like beta-propeller repeat protein [Akkermansiaceae bacterium]|nr:PQQ-binding-like beta-propeller repeat protein [Akkermansiaceae bacterium]MDA7888690.1 PQQ-binding-like beta-propeller repeat protein [Akkermansiaceae bacterium]